VVILYFILLVVAKYWFRGFWLVIFNIVIDVAVCFFFKIRKSFSFPYQEANSQRVPQ